MSGGRGWTMIDSALYQKRTTRCSFDGCVLLVTSSRSSHHTKHINGLMRTCGGGSIHSEHVCLVYFLQFCPTQCNGSLGKRQTTDATGAEMWTWHSDHCKSFGYASSSSDWWTVSHWMKRSLCSLNDDFHQLVQGLKALKPLSLHRVILV